MYSQKKYFLFVLFLLGVQSLVAQDDCVLGVGITANETITSVFQLNEQQAEEMINLGAQLKYENELLSNQLENITKNYPQSSEEDLIKLANKYKVMIDSMKSIQKMTDKKVLALFNKKQYDRYVNLCQEAFRRPLYVIHANYNDSLVTPK